MFFDDRLATVLRQRVTGEASLRTQYRQLLDLLGKNRTHRTGRQHQSLVAAAWLRMDTLAEQIDADDRARMIREPGWRFRSADLAAHLAEQEPSVAAAALARADLSVEDWSALVPRLPVRARGFLRLRRDLPLDVESLLDRLGIHDRGLPRPAEQPELPTAESAKRRVSPPERASQAAIEQEAAGSPLPRGGERGRTRDREDAGRSEISALVERIAQFRRERRESGFDPDIAPRLPLGELPDLPERAIADFGFATDPAARIVWASGEVGPMVVGTRLTAADEADRQDWQGGAITRALFRRQPITGTAFTLEGAPAIAGVWTLDAHPAFNREGHFTGYVGRFRRSVSDADEPVTNEYHEADRIRQLLHELRTPVTAVQGYAEVIQQQLFGPAPNEYRALAAAIAADAARILAGFDELDRLARLETGVLAIEPGEADLARMTRRILDQIGPVLQTREAAIILSPADDASLLVPCETEEVEGLLWRVMASLAAACDTGERLNARLDPLIGNGAAMARLSCSLPASLAREENVFAATARPSGTAINPGLFGAGFAFRLARAEARAAGGELVREGEEMVLTLPLLTGDEMLPGDLGNGAARTPG